MHLIRCLVILFFCLLLGLPVHDLVAAEQSKVRVGVEQNPPLSYFDRFHRPAGLMVDLLSYAAIQDGRQLEYVPCVWGACLEQLYRGEIDLIATIAHSSERAQLYDFTSTTVLNLWGQLYVGEHSTISSYLDLNGKRIALVNNETHAIAFRDLIKQFGLHTSYVVVDNFYEVFDAIQSGRADAGVVGRLFALAKEDSYKVKATQILFNPREIRYAATKGKHSQLLADIDRHLALLQGDHQSYYYQSLERWLGITQKGGLPVWFNPLLMIGGTALLLVVVIALALRSQVKRRTLHLEKEIEERKRYEVQLVRQATYDSLTNLPNRVLLCDRLEQALVRAARQGTVVPVMLIDLDNFKYVNDTLGHDVGDDLLRLVALRLREAIRDNDTVARLGGDEFVVLPTDLINDDDTITIAEKLQETLAAPFKLGEQEYFVTFSMGVAMFPQDGNTGEELMKYADAAMYHAKEQGKNNFQFFTEEINRRAHDRLEKEAQLRRALDRDEFILFYQPLVDMSSGEINGVETLLRWQPLGEGIYPPDSFIPLLEETGMIVPVGRWVLQNACRQARQWELAGMSAMTLSVNVSCRQFHHESFFADVMDALLDSGLPPERLRLELTESLLMVDAAGAAVKMHALAAKGITLSIDDFGTGYSSLSYLRNLPIHELKIDRSFISRVTENSADAVLVNTIIGMAESLNLRVVAEGVETVGQYNFLSEQRCHEIQGFYFSKPLPAESFADLVRSGFRLT
ncbi:MAG: EAL domain-containing protein [Geobacteraceae bacterium]|nr:EAL domain-containing protein [Geobacteraceae bacterium]NTW80700.1 EAL domain-containing protein [Geobacteraceae bacterium]